MRDRGTAILFVSHRLDEVFQLCDTATILRGGVSVASVKISEVDHADLAFHMTGKRLERAEVKKVVTQTTAGEKAALSVENFEVLQSVDTSNVPPTAQSLSLQNVVREDKSCASFPREQILANAPQEDEDSFRVRAVLE